MLCRPLMRFAKATLMTDTPPRPPRTVSATPPIVVAGGGLVGMAAALALADRGWSVNLVSGSTPPPDGRTVALMPQSLALLDSLGLADTLARSGAPLEILRLIDDSGSLFRPPSVAFEARELGLERFATNIENHALLKALSARIEDHPAITVINDQVTGTKDGNGSRQVLLAARQDIETPLLVAADGRRSAIRTALDIRVAHKAYPQVALTAILRHERDHRFTSTEFHTRHGPFTLVPLPGRCSSLVWLTSPEKADTLSGLDDDAFGRAVEDQAQSMLGKMELAGPRGKIGMGIDRIDTITAPRCVLMGDAAHAFPPIGAQGLNLGLRDISDLLACLDLSSDAGAPEVTQRYQSMRHKDISTRTLGVDMLNRSLLSPYLPVDFARGAGLLALASIGPLRQFVMRQGIGR